MIKATEMKKGMVLKVDGKLVVVLDYQHVKLGKGGAVLQTKFKDVLEGNVTNKRIRSEETLEDVYVDRQNYEYLYSAGPDEHVLMHKETFDQITIDGEMFGDGPKYCKPNTDVQIQFFDGKPLAVDLPNSVELEVIDTAPELKGATATNQYKPATLETDLIIAVPPFIKLGDVLRVDTRSGEYIERVKN
ncbi:MAG: elongation factor P [Sedimentisphaerales bacterium]|nr:elongation factor P [Sedimentisphaerales bacterium]